LDRPCTDRTAGGQLLGQALHTKNSWMSAAWTGPAHTEQLEVSCLDRPCTHRTAGGQLLKQTLRTQNSGGKSAVWTGPAHTELYSDKT
jgi:hypothetical protein